MRPNRLVVAAFASLAAHGAAQLSVAHMLVGAARSFPSPSVYVPLRDLFLDGLGGERVHLFVYLDLAPELSPKGQWRAIDRAALDAALLYLREGHDARDARARPPWKAEYPMAVQYHDAPADAGVRCGASCTGQFFKWRRAGEMVIAQERAQGWRFDWVVRSRPDTGYIHPAPPIAALDQRVYYNVDLQVYLPRAKLEGFLDVDAFNCSSGCDGRPCACLLRKQLVAMGVSDARAKKRTPLPKGSGWTRALFSGLIIRTAEASAYIEAVGGIFAIKGTRDDVEHGVYPKALAAVRAAANESGGALTTSEPAEERACRMANAAAAVAAREAAWRRTRGEEVGAARRLSRPQSGPGPSVAQASSVPLACEPTPVLKVERDAREGTPRLLNSSAEQGPLLAGIAI